jgi:Domain of unknown function (DUF4262)
MALANDEQKLVDDVAKFGWHVMKVSSAIDEPEKLPFAYTVGLQTTFGWPELLCYGLETDILARLLNKAVDELRSGAGRPTAGLVLREVAEGFECRLGPVAKCHFAEHLGWAIWFSRYTRQNPSNLQCLQLLWPDREGRFPDEPDCAEGVKELEPLLSA